MLPTEPSGVDMQKEQEKEIQRIQELKKQSPRVDNVNQTPNTVSQATETGQNSVSSSSEQTTQVEQQKQTDVSSVTPSTTKTYSLSEEDIIDINSLDEKGLTKRASDNSKRWHDVAQKIESGELTPEQGKAIQAKLHAENQYINEEVLGNMEFNSTTGEWTKTEGGGTDITTPQTDTDLVKTDKEVDITDVEDSESSYQQALDYYIEEGMEQGDRTKELEELILENMNMKFDYEFDPDDPETKKEINRGLEAIANNLAGRGLRGGTMEADMQSRFTSELMSSMKANALEEFKYEKQSDMQSIMALLDLQNLESQNRQQTIDNVSNALQLMRDKDNTAFTQQMQLLNYGLSKDYYNLDVSKYNFSVEQQEFENAMSRWITDGVLSEYDANILGIPAGTLTSEMYQFRATLADNIQARRENLDLQERQISVQEDLATQAQEQQLTKDENFANLQSLFTNKNVFLENNPQYSEEIEKGTSFSEIAYNVFNDNAEQIISAVGKDYYDQLRKDVANNYNNYGEDVDKQLETVEKNTFNMINSVLSSLEVNSISEIVKVSDYFSYKVDDNNIPILSTMKPRGKDEKERANNINKFLEKITPLDGVVRYLSNNLDKTSRYIVSMSTGLNEIFSALSYIDQQENIQRNSNFKVSDYTPNILNTDMPGYFENNSEKNNIKFNTKKDKLSDYKDVKSLALNPPTDKNALFLADYGSILGTVDLDSSTIPDFNTIPSSQVEKSLMNLLNYDTDFKPNMYVYNSQGDIVGSLGELKNRIIEMQTNNEDVNKYIKNAFNVETDKDYSVSDYLEGRITVDQYLNSIIKYSSNKILEQ